MFQNTCTRCFRTISEHKSFIITFLLDNQMRFLRFLLAMDEKDRAGRDLFSSDDVNKPMNEDVVKCFLFF